MMQPTRNSGSLRRRSRKAKRLPACSTAMSMCWSISSGTAALFCIASMPDARIEIGVHDVEQQIDHQRHEGDDQHDALNRRIVEGEDRAHGVLPDAAHRED